MSSLVRRIQKNIAKSMGYRRDRTTGDIVTVDGDSVSKRWPQVSAPKRKEDLQSHEIQA